MKEIVKSKIMIGFVAFILGITYMNGIQTKQMEEKSNTNQDSYLAMNLK